METMLTNKNGFKLNVPLNIFLIDICDLFTHFLSHIKINITYLLRPVCFIRFIVLIAVSYTHLDVYKRQEKITLVKT